MGLNIGQAISRTFETMKDRFVSLIAIWFVFFAIQIAIFLVIGLTMGASAGALFSGAAPGALGGGAFFLIFLLYLAYLAVYFGQAGALVAAASPLQRLSFGGAFNAGIRSIPTYLALFILFIVAYFAVALVVGLIGGILSFAGSAVVTVFSVAVFVGAIYLLCRLAVINSVVAVEGVRNPITAAARGWSLTKASALPIFALLFVFGLVFLVLFGLLFIPFYTTVFAGISAGTPPSFSGMGSTLAGFFVAMMAVSVIVAIAMMSLLAVIHAELAGTVEENTSAVFA